MTLTCDEISNLTANAVSAMKPRTCPHCGMYHTTTCPRVRAIEYHQDGTVKRVEFHTYAPVSITAETPAR